MKLYCNPHGTVHEFTAGEVERIVYALSGEVASALSEPDGDRIFAGEDGYERIPCPKDYLEMSRSIEGYGELTEASVSARRRVERGLPVKEAS